MAWARQRVEPYRQRSSQYSEILRIKTQMLPAPAVATLENIGHDSCQDGRKDQ